MSRYVSAGITVGSVTLIFALLGVAYLPPPLEAKSPQSGLVSHDPIPSETGKVQLGSGWKHQQPAMVVAADKTSYGYVTRLIKAGKVKHEFKEYDPDLIYFFCFVGYSEKKAGEQLEVKKVWRVGPMRVRYKDGDGTADVFHVETVIAKADAKAKDKPRVQGDDSPWILVTVKRKDLKKPTSRDTTFLLKVGGKEVATATARQAAHYAPGSEWFVRFDAKESKAAIKACKDIGLEVKEDEVENDRMVVVIKQETKIALLTRLPDDCEAITAVRARLRSTKAK